MPGICGIIDANPSKAEPRLDGMLASMRHHSWYVESRYVSSEIGVELGRMALGSPGDDRQPAKSAAGSTVLFVDGELYDEDPKGGGYAIRLLDGIAARGQDFLRGLNGSFAAALWDDSRRSLTLVNDRFGTRPLYYAHAGGRFLFASSIAALLTDPAVGRDVNLKGIAQFFTFGHYFGDDTSVAGVRVLPAGAWLTYDATTDRLAIDRYHRLEDPVGPTRLAGAALLDDLDAKLDAAIRRRTAGTDGLGIALSGGLDARTILGVMDGPHTRVTSICYSMPGSLDDRASREMTTQVGSPYHNYVLGATFLRDFGQHLEDMVRLTDGQYLSQCIVMPTLPLYRELGISALLRGHAGELLHMRKAYNYSIDADALAIQSQSQLESWLWKRLASYLLAGLEKPIFRPHVQSEVEGLARESLREAIEPLAAAGPAPQRIWHAFLTGRLRRETSLSMVKFRSVVEPRLPYLDNDLVDAILATPIERKLGDQIQSHVLAKHRPGFLSVLNANTGAPLRAGVIRTKASSFRRRALAKLGFAGYQPYERLGLWLRRELAPTVRDILLDERCLERDFFSADGIRATVEAHLAGRRNHTYLLMALMIVELGQRRFAGLASSPRAAPRGEKMPV